MASHTAVAPSRQLLNKVPEVTVYFWVIKEGYSATRI